MTIKSIRTGWTGISALAGNPVLGDFESIQTVTVGSTPVADVVFSSIPSTYQHLQIRYIARSNPAGNTFGNLWMRTNGDTGSNYTYHLVRGNGTDAASGGAGSIAQNWAGVISGPNAATSVFAVGVIDILDYASTNKTKVIRSLTGFENNTTTCYISLFSGLWNNTTDAINSLRLFDGSSGNIVQHSHFALYGIR
jgi:hypothetical protein